MAERPKPVIICDSREKHGWPLEDDGFEGVVHKKLDAGDYSIEGLESVVSIERKAHADELFINFTQNKDRILAEFERLKNYKYKFIIVEQSFEDACNPNKYYVNQRKINKQNFSMPVAVVLSNVFDAMLKYNIHVIFAGDRAESVAKKLLLTIHKYESKRNK